MSTGVVVSRIARAFRTDGEIVRRAERLAPGLRMPVYLGRLRQH